MGFAIPYIDPQMMSCHRCSTGRFLGAKEAMSWGLVNSVVAPEQLMPHCLNMAKEMTKMKLVSIRWMSHEFSHIKCLNLTTYIVCNIAIYSWCLSNVLPSPIFAG